MIQGMDVPASPSGHSAEPEPSYTVSAVPVSVPNAVRPDSELNLAELSALVDKATGGPWRIDQGVMADSLWITAYEREPSYRDHDKHDGPICHVSTEKMHFKSDKDHLGNSRGESRSWKTPIKKARADAELIVAAVNALPELIRRAGFDGDETAWLIEWPADVYGPIRYWAAGHSRPVIDVNKATRFARKQDAVAVMGAHAEKGAKVHEHMWMRPAQAIEARRAETSSGSVADESAVAESDAPKC